MSTSVDSDQGNTRAHAMRGNAYGLFCEAMRKTVDGTPT